MGQSRVEDILEATINTEPYNEDPQSRIEELLIELKEAIEQGGGGGGTTVIPNPSGEATDDLEKVQIGSTIFDIPEGGTDVEANPSGTATDDLESIRIGNDIFSIPSGGGGTNAEEMTLHDYGNLTPAQQNDGTIRFIPRDETGLTEPIDMEHIQSFIESGNVMGVTSTEDTSIITYAGGVYIGISYYYTTPIDVTDWDMITFSVQTGSCYGGGATAQQKRWNLQIGLMESPITGMQNIDADNPLWKAVGEFADSNKDYGEVSIDVSELTGEYYLTVVPVGWNAVIDNIQLALFGNNPSQIKFMSKTYGIANIKEITQGEYDDLPNSEKNDGTVFFTHDGGYDYINYDNGKIIVRVNTSDPTDCLWFFNGWNKGLNDIDIPEELVPYAPTKTSAVDAMQAKAWSDSSSTSHVGWIGFVYPGKSNVKMRSWSTNFTSLAEFDAWAILDINGSVEQGGQTEEYQDAYTYPTSSEITPNRIYMNGRQYASDAKVQRTTLYEGSATTASGTLFELSDDLFNYDYIHITVQNSSGTVDTKLIDTRYLSVGDLFFVGDVNGGLENGWCRWTITSGTVLTGYDTAGTTVCKAIIGIKL